MAVPHERRTGFATSEIVDQALDLISQCGWRYALVYLIHHGVSQEVVQRLLAGACVRRHAQPRPVDYHSLDTRRGSRDEDMAKLLDFLQRRRFAAGLAGGNRPALAARHEAERI